MFHPPQRKLLTSLFGWPIRGIDTWRMRSTQLKIILAHLAIPGRGRRLS